MSTNKAPSSNQALPTIRGARQGGLGDTMLEREQQERARLDRFLAY